MSFFYSLGSFFNMKCADSVARTLHCCAKPTIELSPAQPQRLANTIPVMMIAQPA
jgi:hypothetical protein